ncbi:dystroglycan-like [Dorcoceras hygrometricum]|uniref:Dystroglycan-like n=1 Tax=Dorcoceras hygrometricum TaxID=472368 RepID=A0A2Z7BIW0_9LAMI|nr:dystroglycan-like [Dorcoceras hygrometricum]
MASSLYSNAQHVDFDSVLAMDDPGMVSMFEALMASGLRGFLGCPAVVYEDALIDFFENASVRNGVVFSTVGGQIVEITEKLFAESFELPVDGLGDLSEMPKDAIFDARSIVSLSGEQINLSGRKNQMKMPYRLLCDIVAKAISVKAGSFNAITVEKFSLMTAVVCGVKMNWEKFLFGILKRMVAAKSKQAKGFAIQISLLLATFPAVELGEASEFPASKILSKKTVLRFVSINDRDGAEEVSGAAAKKAVSKKRTAADIEAAVPKKKRTSKKRSISSISSLEMVALAEEAVPIQQVAEQLDVEEPRCSSADAVDLIIQQVLDETRAADAPADTTEPAVTEEKNWFDLPYEDIVKQWEAERPVVTASDTEDEDVATADVLDETRAADAPADTTEPAVTEEKNWFDLPYEDNVKQWEAERPVVTPSDTEEEDVATAEVAPADEVQQVPDFEAPISAEERQYDDTLPTMSVFFKLMRKRWADVCLEAVEFCVQRLLPVDSIRSCRSLQLSASVSSFDSRRPTVFELRVSQFCSVFVNLSLFNRISSAEITEFLSVIALEKTVLRGVQCSQDSFSVAPRVQLALEQQQSSSSSSSSSLRFDHTDLFESQSNISSKLYKIEQNVRDSLSDQAAVFKSLSQEARQENRTLDDVQTIRFNEFRKHVLEQNASIFVGLAEVRKEVQEVNTKVDIMVMRLNDIQKDAEATKEAHSHQLLEFQSQAQENHTVIHAQLSELVDYIHRGRADKKGESGNRGPQQPAATQITGSAVTPSFEQRVQMAQRRIVHTVINADAANRESQEAAERDRERRRKEARSLKRRRKD